MTSGARRRASPIVALVSVALLAACGPAPRPTPGPTPTEEPLPTPVTTTYLVNETAWYAGLIIHLDTVTTVLNQGVGSVSAAVRIENPAADPASLDAPVRLAASGEAIDPVPGTEIPDVDAGGAVAVSIPFDIDAGFEIGRAALRIGRPADHQAVLPLVAGTQDLVTLEPVELALAGTATAGALRLTVTGGELRADLPDWGLELGPGTLALTVTYDARYTGDFAGGFAFTGANVGLKLPNGTIVAAREDGHSQSVAVLQPAATMAGLSSRFDVAVPGTGSYALVVRDGTSTATIPIEVKAPAGGG